MVLHTGPRKPVDSLVQTLVQAVVLSCDINVGKRLQRNL